VKSANLLKPDFAAAFNFYKAPYCKLCDSDNLEIRLNLAPTPPAEWYLKADKKQLTEVSVPLDLYQCIDCGHVQLVDIISPEALYSGYFYTTESSPGLKEYFSTYAKHVIQLLGLRNNQKILDIGSNDGTFLRFFKDLDFDVIGVEPSLQLAVDANKSGIHTLNNFFDRSCVELILERHGKVDLVTANNVFAHSENLFSMLEYVEQVLSPRGFFVFEVSYLYDTIVNNVFDFIYHEHVSYHSVKPLKSFLSRVNMELFHVERTKSKGGTIRCFARKIDSSSQKSYSTVKQLVELEERSGLYDSQVYSQMQKKLQQLAVRFRKSLETVKEKKGKIAGYGACATVTTLLHQFDIGSLIDFLVDDNPIRHGTFSPGHHIPVFAPSSINAKEVDCVAILAWRFERQIKEKNRTLFLDKEIIVPRIR
jgi:SAM-dependent methyltransferase